MNLENLLEEGSLELGINLKSGHAEQFLTYLDLIKKWNSKINLTSITEEDEIILKHFLDSLTVSVFLKDRSKILDIGSGAGFPGIPLSIVRESLNVTVMDSREKKMYFIKEVIRELNLMNVETFAVRAEDSSNGVPRNYFDYVLTRAVGVIEEVVKLSEPYLKSGGKMILMRGKEGKIEWESYENNNYELMDLRELTIPKSNFKRVLLVISGKK